MPLETQIIHAANRYETKSFAFPGGEQQVQIPDLPDNISGDITVVSRLQSSNDLIRLLLTCEILGRVQRSGFKRLVIPYFPYARQDRVMRWAEAFSLKPVTRLINGLCFNEIVTCDPHSDVTSALVENIRIIAQVDLITDHEDIGRIIHSNVTIVAPDAGAAKKAFAVASYYRLPLLTASKVRDVTTGTISRTEVHGAESIQGRNALIVDDICDGGRTFIELAKVLKSNGAAKVYLYVTHGIFSQGLGVFSSLIDGIFTTDSFQSDQTQDRLPYPPLHISPIHF